MRYWLSISLVFIFYAASSQTIPYLKYGVEDGLGNSIVYSAYQDSKGYMWFCTDHGLSKFDGHHFTNYTTADGFPANNIMSVAETSDGELRVGVYGYGCYKLHNEKFIPLHPDVPDAPHFLINMAIDKTDRIWIFSSGNATKDLWYIEKDHYKRFSINSYTHDTLQYVYYNVFTQSDGTVLLGTNHGLFAFKDEKIKPLVSTSVIYAMDTDKNGNLWLGSDGKVLEYSAGKVTQVITTALKKDIPVGAVKADAEGRLWITEFPHRLFVMNASDGELIYADDLPINNFLLDRENNIWATTYGQGVLCFNCPDITNYTVKDGLTDNIILTSIEDSKGKVWIKTLRGINYISNGKSEKEHVTTFLKLDELFGFTLDKDDDVIYGSGLCLVILKKGLTRKIPMKNRIITLYTDPHNTIWIATTEGVACYRHDSLLYPRGLSMLDDKKIFTITTDSDGKLWMGTNEGAYCYDHTILTHYTAGDGLSNNTVNYIWQDANKRIWFATDEGISIFDKGKWTNDSLLKCISNIPCTALTGDHNGNVWIGTSNGLYIYGNGRIQKLDDKTGVAGVEIQSLYLDKKNYLWVGTMKGLSKINLNAYSYIVNSYSPQVYIQNVKVNDRIIAIHDTSLILKYYDNNISISYVGLYFKNPRSVLYEYKLSGASEIWRKAAGTTLEFSSLSPGTYTFLVKALSPAGIYSKIPARFSFIIQPPYWMRAWFICLETFLLIVILFIVFRWRLRILKRRALLKEELLNAKKTLDDYTRSMIEKNELLEQFKLDLENIKKLKAREIDENRIEHIEQLNKTTILTDDDWNKFKQLFEHVHKGFFIRLKEKLPDLTPGEIRLICLTKLQLDTNQMAGILGVSSATIWQTRYLLRKKLGLSGKDDLNDIANSI